MTRYCGPQPCKGKEQPCSYHPHCKDILDLPSAVELPSDENIDMVLEQRCVFEPPPAWNLTHLYCSDMMAKDDMSVLLLSLKAVLDSKVPGAVLEVGANKGTTSTFIMQQLKLRNEDREMHCYDSFEGFRESRSTHDVGRANVANADEDAHYIAPIDSFYKNFASMQLELPHIHKGFVEDLPEAAWPQEVAFAFLDVDLYDPMLYSLSKISKRLSKGGKMVMHEYNIGSFEGASWALRDFMSKLDADSAGHFSAENAWHCPCGVAMVTRTA